MVLRVNDVSYKKVRLKEISKKPSWAIHMMSTCIAKKM